MGAASLKKNDPDKSWKLHDARSPRFMPVTGLDLKIGDAFKSKSTVHEDTEFLAIVIDSEPTIIQSNHHKQYGYILFIVPYETSSRVQFVDKNPAGLFREYNICELNRQEYQLFSRGIRERYIPLVQNRIRRGRLTH